MTDEEREADSYRLEPKGTRFWIEQARRALRGEADANGEEGPAVSMSEENT